MYFDCNVFLDGTDQDNRLPLISAQNPFVLGDAIIAILTGDDKLIDLEYLSLGKEIGKGNFGCIYQGELHLPNIDRNVVAVKTLATKRMYQHISDLQYFDLKCYFQS